MKSKRLLDLMKRVEGLERFTVQELADEFDVSYRTMWRYLQELSELGVPLYSEPGAAGGYRVLRQRPAREAGPPRPTSQTAAATGLQSAPPAQGQLVDLPTFHLVGFCFTAPYHARAEAGVLVPRLWMQLLSRLDEICHHADPAVRLGLALLGPKAFTYYLGLEVTAVDAVPADMVSLTVPAHRYARFTHVGSMEREQVDATFLNAFAAIEARGLVRDREAPWIERYDHRYDPASPTNAFEIDLPVWSSKKAALNGEPR